MDTELPQRLLVGVALERPPAGPGAAVDALARAVEDVVMPAMFVDLDWRTTVVTPADDLERGRGRQTRGCDWDAVRTAAPNLESGGVAGLRQDVPHDLLPQDPTVNPVNAVARMPGRPATLAWSVHRWAVREDGNPNAGTTYGVGDGGPAKADQRSIVDASFLDLVRYGIESPKDPAVLSSLPVIDKELKVSTPNGPFWRRYSFDGYGETRTGGEWRITDPGTGTTLGRAWPLLAGERGEYTVTAGGSGTPYLRAMARATGEGDMLAEQVWDNRPPTGKPCCPAGEGTRSATPLTWSHAGLVRLAWTIQRGAPVDQQAVVADRY